jgi:hypothetical protein
MAERLRVLWDALCEDNSLLGDLRLLAGLRRGLLLVYLLLVAFALGLILGMGLVVWGR